MDRVSRHSWFRSARSPGVPLLALIVLLGVGGYFLTSTIISHDRDEAAARRARVEAVHAQEVLGRARAYVVGLSDVLARETEPGQAQFARWAGATSASVGLNDVLWVERVPADERARYERDRGIQITRLTTAGRLVRAPAAPAYLPATFTSQTRPELRPGVDVAGFPGLDQAIRDRARIFAVGASRSGALGREPGFYLLEAATFARGRHSDGYLVAFVPRGWFATTLGGDPRRLAVSEDGRRIEGRLDAVHASAGFEMLGRDWRIDVGREPPSGMQSTLPWLALVWPLAVAGIVLPIGRAVTQRRSAQREVERIVELSLDMIGVVDLEGRFKAVNPAFERTLGYTRQQMLGRPFYDFMHPDDIDASAEAFAGVVRGEAVSGFQNRYIGADGSERWLEWSARIVPEQGVVHSIARDVTERRRIAAELTESRDVLGQLAEEQTALRRVATLVAEGASPGGVLDAVAAEMEGVLRADAVTLSRYESGDEVTVVAHRGSDPRRVPPGTRVSHRGENVTTMVRRTAHSVRMEHDEGKLGAIADLGRDVGVRASLGAPIVVDGRLWGVAVATWRGGETPPAGTEERMAHFTELLDTAIANADSRHQLIDSRARLVTEADDARRRVVRDLHDGAQQRLVHTIVTLKLAKQALRDGDGTAESVVGEALEQAERANSELRELAHGILPAVLTSGGLQAGVDSVVSRLDMPVDVDVPTERFPKEIEAVAYFIVAEAITNVVKHAQARRAGIRATVQDGTLHLEVSDDGIGGANLAGHGLVGMDDRVTALGGRLHVENRPGGGTVVSATLPLAQ
jgi:PAS domain S-box-containing protein